MDAQVKVTVEKLFEVQGKGEKLVECAVLVEGLGDKLPTQLSLTPSVASADKPEWFANFVQKWIYRTRKVADVPVLVTFGNFID